MYVECVSRGSLQLFTPGWWLEGPSWHVLEAAFPAVVYRLGGRRDQCPPRSVLGWSLGRWKTVHSVLLEDQTWTQSLSPEIAPSSRDPWNSAGSPQGWRAWAATLGSFLIGSEMEMGPGTGSSEHMLWHWARDNVGPRQGVLQTQPSLKSQIPSKLEIS